MPRQSSSHHCVSRGKSPWPAWSLLLAIGMIAGMAGTRCPARTPAQSPGWMGSCASENKAGSGATRASDHATTGTPAAAARPKSADSAATPVLSLSGVATADGPDTNTVGWIALPSGARYQEIHVGKGRIPSPGVAVHLHMKIFDSRGKLIQNTFADRAAYIFTYGRDEVFPAFEEAVASMREGGKRRIVFPPEIGFWSQGYDDEERDVHIERDATLLFEVSFMWLREPEFDKIGIFK